MLLKEIPGINPPVDITAHLKMKVRSAGFARAAKQADHLSLGDGLAAGYTDGFKVGVKGLPTITVVNNDDVPITVIIPSGVHDHTGIGGKHTIV